jgi:hypothetical protein
MRAEVAADLRAIFDAPDREEADRRLKLAVQKYEKDCAQARHLDGGQRIRRLDRFHAAAGAPAPLADFELIKQ